jgi:uncharacterized membrane protein YdbT with pleckstrin-like domain
MKGEVVSYKTNLTWFIFFWPVVLSIILLPLLSGLNLMVTVPWLIIAIVDYISSEFVMKTGVIKRQTHETQVNKIERINVEQGIIGRLLGYGTIMVSGTGGGITPFKNVADPFTFRKRIQEQINILEESKR